MLKFARLPLQNFGDSVLPEVGNQCYFSSKSNRPVPRNLDNYDIVVIGGNNLGGVVSRQIDFLTKRRFNTFIVFEKPNFDNTHMRMVYEQGLLPEDKYTQSKISTISHLQAHSDGIGVEKILPEENAIILKNGRQISYRKLIIEDVLPSNLELVPGLKEAVTDSDHPVALLNVFMHYDKYRCTEGSSKKIFKNNEISSKNDKNSTHQEKDSAPFNLTVLNSNDGFSKYCPEADQFIKSELEKRQINVKYNANLLQVNKNQRTLTFQTSDKQQSTVPYDSLYSLVPMTQSNLIKDSGLGSTQNPGLLSVDEGLLQHKKYKNIFGLGQVCDLPTTHSVEATQNQLDVVRNNVIRSLQGQSLNGVYQGYTQVPLYISYNKLTFVSHTYGGTTTKRFNLIDKSGGLISRARYYLWTYLHPHLHKLFLSFQVWGAPYFVQPRCFSDSTSSTPTKVETKEEPTTSSYYKISRKVVDGAYSFTDVPKAASSTATASQKSAPEKPSTTNKTSPPPPASEPQPTPTPTPVESTSTVTPPVAASTDNSQKVENEPLGSVNKSEATSSISADQQSDVSAGEASDGSATTATTQQKRKNSKGGETDLESDTEGTGAEKQKRKPRAKQN